MTKLHGYLHNFFRTLYIKNFKFNALFAAHLFFLFHPFFKIVRHKNLHRPGSQSPPLPPPPPPEDDGNQHFGRPRTQSVGPLAPIVPEDQNLPGWVPKNYIEKGILFILICIFFQYPAMCDAIYWKWLKTNSKNILFTLLYFFASCCYLRLLCG